MIEFWERGSVSKPEPLDLGDNGPVFSRDYRLAILLPLIISFSAFPQSKTSYDAKKCEAAPSLPLSRAEKDVIEKGAVEIPPLAKSMQMQRIAQVEVCVSETGEVIAAKPVRCHPIFYFAAIDSAKQWRFKPQQAGPFKTILEISFSQGSSPAEIAAEEKINIEYFAQQGKCRESLSAKEFDDALKLCTAAADLVEKLPKQRFMERMTAYQLVGHVYFAQRRFDEALRSYKTELQIGLDSLQPYNAELANAYHDVALASHVLGRASEATQHYAKAEQTMSQARDHIDSDELKLRYSATLKQIRKHYLLLLQQTRQTATAADLEKRIQDAGK